MRVSSVLDDKIPAYLILVWDKLSVVVWVTTINATALLIVKENNVNGNAVMCAGESLAGMEEVASAVRMVLLISVFVDLAIVAANAKVLLIRVVQTHAYMADFASALNRAINAVVHLVAMGVIASVSVTALIRFPL